MAEFRKAVPSTLGDLKTYLQKMFENRSHVKGVKLNPSNGHLEIDLDWMANAAGFPDVYMPIKRGKFNDAKAIVEKMLKDIGHGFAPGDSDAQMLFDSIDQQAGG